MRTTLSLIAWMLFGSLCQAQVVQQPVFRNFSYSGSAWVPDAGTASLGGNVYSRSGSIGRGIGPYAPRASSSSLGGSSLTVSAVIIDLDALDEALLNTSVSQSVPTTTSRTSAPTANASTAQATKKAVSRLAGVGRKVLNTTDPNAISSTNTVVARNRNALNRALHGHMSTIRKPAVSSQVESDVRYYLAEGLKAEQAGHIVAARVFFRMAMQTMTPEMLIRYEKVLARKKAEEEAASDRNRPDSIKF